MPEMTFAMAINDALRLEMERDPKIYIAGEDVSHGGPMSVTSGLAEKFGKKRIRDTPISESAIIGSAVGAAACGLRPIVELMFVDFIEGENYVEESYIFTNCCAYWKCKFFIFSGKRKIC